MGTFSLDYLLTIVWEDKICFGNDVMPKIYIEHFSDLFV